MLTLRGQRLLNNLLAGSLSAATLEAELADAGAKFSLREMLDGSPRHARMLLANTTARTAVLGSAVARGILVECRTAVAVAAKERDILLALAADANTRTTINASTVALRAIAANDAAAVTWMAQLMGIAGNHATDAVWMFCQNASFASSAPALFLLAVNPALAAAVCFANKASGNNAAINTALNASPLFTRIATETYVPAVKKEFRWQDEVIILGVSINCGGPSGSQDLYGADPNRSRQCFLGSFQYGLAPALSFFAPRGLWHEAVNGPAILNSLSCTTYVAK